MILNSLVNKKVSKQNPQNRESWLTLILMKTTCTCMYCKYTCSVYSVAVLLYMCIKRAIVTMFMVTMLPYSLVNIMLIIISTYMQVHRKTCTHHGYSNAPK